MQRCDVLFLIRSMDRGGAERQLNLLARSLQARGLNIVVAVFYAGGDLEQELHDAGIEVLDLEKSGTWSNMRMVRRLMDFVRARRPRVLHSYLVVPNVLALLMASWLRKRGCVVVCGVRTALKNAWKYHAVAGCLGALQPLLMHRAGAVISNSNAAIDGLKHGKDRVRKFVIPNGIEHDRYRYSEPARLSLRTIWGVPKGAVLIGLVARLDPQKNHIYAIDAMRLVAASCDAYLVFVGDGPERYKQKLRAHAEAIGVSPRVLWAGTFSDMAKVYSALDVVCLCSLTEGFPNVLAEAMCVGLPCVTTAVGDAAAVVGTCGWVVTPDDPRVLASALVDACRVLPGWDRTQPRARMIELYSVDALTNRTLAALSPFLGEAAE